MKYLLKECPKKATKNIEKESEGKTKEGLADEISKVYMVLF